MTRAEGSVDLRSSRICGSHGRRRFFFVLLSILIRPLLNGDLAIASNIDRPTVLIIPHTHWEGAVFKTREEYLDLGLSNILKVLYLLKKYPSYHFVLDQMCYVRPFLERYPSEEPAFREFLGQGRLQIAGGTDTMNDNNMPSGESTVRQYLLAKSYFRERLGYEVTTGWALDTFGHNAQMPQILKLAGMKSYWFMRGTSTSETPSEFLWQGIDGSRIPAFWLALTYGPLADIPGSPVEFQQRLTSLFDDLVPFGHHPERALLAGTDVAEPAESLPGLVDKFNQSEMSLKAQLAVPADFERLVAKRADQPILRGELNPVGQGIYSNRIELKQTMRHIESLLAVAEHLSVIASVVGAGAHPEIIEQAWEPVLFNAEHDPAAGAVVDKVYDEEIEDYARARQLAQDSILRDFASITGQINTSGAGVPLVVFNSLGWRRTDLAEVDVPFSEPDVHAFSVLDAAGRLVPIQVLNVTRNGDGGIRLAHVALIARDIPPLGYAVFHAVPTGAASRVTLVPGDDFFSSQLSNTAYKDQSPLENEFYRMSFDLRTGAMTGLILKENNWEVLQAPGNVVARETDGGDPWELYGNLSGGLVSTKKPTLPPRAAYTQWSSDFGGYGAVTPGPVFSEYHARPHPFGKNQFSTRVRVYAGLRRIDIHTELVNQEPFVRYRAIFPTTLPIGTAVHEIPFGAIERLQEQEYPAQNWVDYGDGRKGLTLINRGIPGNNVAGGRLMLSLMRSTNLAAYPFVGGNEPGVGSDTGLGVGRKYTFDYALIPHLGDWRSAAPWRAGLEFNNPLIVRAVATHRGHLPSTWSLLEVSPSSVVVSALKPGKDGITVLRVYEAAGKPADHVHVMFHHELTDVHEANLIEDVGPRVSSDSDGFVFDLRPFEIKTFTIRFKAVAQ